MATASRRVALASLLFLGGCTASVDTTWHERDGHRSLDASACDGAAQGPAHLRCLATDFGPGLAVCGALAGDNTLTIDRRAAAPLALAVDGDTRVGSPFRIGGDFVEAAALARPNTIEVEGDLFVRNTWTVSSPAHVTGDAYLASGLDASNTVRVDGTLHIASSEPVGSGVSAGAMAREDVVVRSPLACADAIQIGALVDQAAARGSLVPATLRASDLTLGCGNYVLSSVGVDAPLTIQVAGNVVLAIAGDVRIGAPVIFEVAPGASLDLVIAGSLAIDNTLDFLTTDARAIWVGVGGDVRVGSPTHLPGRLVIPDGSLAADNTLEVSGAVHAHDVRVGSPLVIHDGASLSPTGCAID